MSLPFSLNTAQLALILDMKVSTLQRNVSRDPDSLPPFLPKKKGQVWITEVVIAWMEKRMSQPIIFKIELVASSVVSNSSSLAHSAPPRMGSLAEDFMSSLLGGAGQ